MIRLWRPRRTLSGAQGAKAHGAVYPLVSSKSPMPAVLVHFLSASQDSARLLHHVGTTQPALPYLEASQHPWRPIAQKMPTEDVCRWMHGCASKGRHQGPVPSTGAALSRSHSSGVRHFAVQAWIAAISSLSAALTQRWRLRELRPSNWGETMRALKAWPHPPGSSAPGDGQRGDREEAREGTDGCFA